MRSPKIVSSPARRTEACTRVRRLFDTTAAGSAIWRSASRTPLIGLTESAIATSQLWSIVSRKCSGSVRLKRSATSARKREVCWPKAEATAARKSTPGKVRLSVSKSTWSAMTSLSTSTPSQSQMRWSIMRKTKKQP